MGICVLISWSVLSIPPEVFLSLLLKVRTLASAGGPDNVVMLDPGKYKARPRVPEPAGDGSSTHPKWQIGEQEYEALMRMLDNLVRMAEVHYLKSIGEGRHRNKTHVLCFHPPSGLQNRLPIPLSSIARQS